MPYTFWELVSQSCPTCCGIVFIQIVEASDSVMSKHLSALAEAGFIKLSKAKQDGRQRTWASITSPGRRALTSHLAALRAMIETAQAAVAAE